jgi:hypothetical protein
MFSMCFHKVFTAPLISIPVVWPGGGGPEWSGNKSICYAGATHYTQRISSRLTPGLWSKSIHGLLSLYMVKYEYFILLPHKVLVMLEMARSHMEWLLFRSIPRKLFLKYRRFSVLVERNKRILFVLLLSTNIIDSIQYKSSIFHYFSLFFKCCRRITTL